MCKTVHARYIVNFVWFFGWFLNAQFILFLIVMKFFFTFHDFFLGESDIFRLYLHIVVWLTVNIDSKCGCR